MRLAGLGVDIIALSRARQFLREHRAKALLRLLTKSEKKQMGRKRLTPLLFSKYFTAKEAFFKATGGSWMGLEGFRSIDVKFLREGQFQVESLSSRGRKLKVPGSLQQTKPSTFSGAFFRSQAFIGAQVIWWQ